MIDAFNSDKPYDEFVREQIAGDILAHQAAARDEVTPERFAEQVTATGYIAITKRFGYNINNEFQHLDIADTLDNLGHTFLGLSIGCARCHDHKYDAITAADYYALYGIFSSSQYSFPGGEEYKRPHNLVPLVLPREVAAAQQRIAIETAAIDEQVAVLQRQRDELVRRRAWVSAATRAWSCRRLVSPAGRRGSPRDRTPSLQKLKARTPTSTHPAGKVCG